MTFQRCFPARLAALAVIWGLLAPGSAESFQWPWRISHPWPKSSDSEVTALDHPRVEERFAARDAESPYRFAVFGDQRALANGEWQELIRRIVETEEKDGGVAFMIDTGDIVHDGTHSDQFAFLREILEPARHVPYLVGVGNHELHNLKNREARENAARFLEYLDPDVSPERFHYRKDLGAATFLFLDTNPFVYGREGERKMCPPELDPEGSAGAQMRWLIEQLEELAAHDRLVIAAMHHPFVQSSKKHREVAASLWNCTYAGRSLADRLVEGGVDLVLVGHTHTYERFRLVRDDGLRLDFVNVSGRPKDTVLWFGSRSRRTRDIRGREREFLEENGWRGLERWEITQEDLAPDGDEENQFALLTVDSQGGLSMEVHFLDEDAPGGTRTSEPVRLH